MRILGLLLLSCLFYCCHFEEIEQEHGDCMTAKISAFKLSPEACTDGASIYTYQFQGNLVYIFNPGSCTADFFSNVYDKDCNLVCSLGGIAGNITCNGEKFSDAATEETLIWKN